jgi:2-keto-3-deoxy-L-rhamnonate aldolase RhmA
MSEQRKGGDTKTGANWSRRLPQALVMPRVMTLRTLDDVRALIRYLPEGRRASTPWRHVKQKLEQAADGGDLTDVEAALRAALSLEGVEYRVG